MTRMPSRSAMKWRANIRAIAETVRFSRLGEQLRHRLLVGYCTGPTGRHPLTMSSQRALNLS